MVALGRAGTTFDDELLLATDAALGLRIVFSLVDPLLSLDAVVLAVTAAAVVDDDVDDEDGVAVVVTDCAAASSAAEVTPSFTVLSSVDDAVEAETNLTKMTCNKALSYVRKKIE